MASDDLDAQVARKLGWKSVGYFTGCGDEPGTFAEATRADLFGRPPDSHTGAFVPYFSTDISAAMELLSGRHWHLWHDAYGYTARIYSRIYCGPAKGIIGSVEESAATPALAIVQAFLQLPENSTKGNSNEGC